MALNAGDKDATAGMAKAICDAMGAEIDLSSMKPEEADAVRAKWKPLAFAIASGVVASLTADPANSPDNYGECVSSTTADTLYWAWLSDFVGLFTAWAPTTPDGLALKDAIGTYLQQNPIPTALKGVIK